MQSTRPLRLFLLLAMTLGVTLPGKALTPDFLNARLIPPYTGPQSGSQQGWSVALAGDVAIVGAPYDDLGVEDAGVVKVYQTGTGALLHTIRNPEPYTAERFGEAVAISGSRVAISCSGNYVNGLQHSGSVYIYDLASATPDRPVHT